MIIAVKLEHLLAWTILSILIWNWIGVKSKSENGNMTIKQLIESVKINENIIREQQKTINFLKKKRRQHAKLRHS